VIIEVYSTFLEGIVRTINVIFVKPAFIYEPKPSS